MSLYSSENWGAQCSSANQSPINLSQSSAKPCNLSCDLVMDNGEVPSANVLSSPAGLVLSGNLGSCKFRGESYVCQTLILTHPSHHTIEGVQADAEIVAFFQKPTGEKLMLSSLIRITSTQTPSYFFFKQFVPFAAADKPTPVSMKEWSISAMVPAEASYYVYAGSSILPPCEPAEWVVFKSMINMDQGDFAYLVRNVQAGSRPIQNLGQREVFFNDTNNVPGGPMPHDNKYYLRLRPTGNTKVADLKPKQVDLKKEEKKSKKDEEAEKDSTVLGQTQKSIEEYIAKYGWVGVILGAVAIIGIGYGAYYGYQGSKEKPLTGESMKPIAIWTRDKLWYVVTFIYGCFTWFWTSIYGLAKAIWNIFIGAEVEIEGDAIDTGKALLKSATAQAHAAQAAAERSQREAEASL
jgi:carbonic anhydrase